MYTSLTLTEAEIPWVREALRLYRERLVNAQLRAIAGEQVGASIQALAVGIKAVNDAEEQLPNTPSLPPM